MITTSRHKGSEGCKDWSINRLTVWGISYGLQGMQSTLSYLTLSCLELLLICWNLPEATVSWDRWHSDYRTISWDPSKRKKTRERIWSGKCQASRMLSLDTDAMEHPRECGRRIRVALFSQPDGNHGILCFLEWVLSLKTKTNKKNPKVSGWGISSLLPSYPTSPCGTIGTRLLTLTEISRQG